MRVLTQHLIQEAAVAVYGSPVARHAGAEGTVTEYDLSGDWPVKTLIQVVSEALGEEITLDGLGIRDTILFPLVRPHA